MEPAAAAGPAALTHSPCRCRCRPDHPEVAHTLTDLAVLHLEQGRDGVGRPLLERALAIQTQALGPDHPDVLAIKDVLNSE